MLDSMPNIIAPRTAIPSGIPDAQMLANELPMMVPNTAPEMPSANPSAAPLAVKAIPFKKPCDIEPPKKSDVYKAKRSVATVKYIDILCSSFRLSGEASAIVKPAWCIQVAIIIFLLLTAYYSFVTRCGLIFRGDLL